MRALYVQTSSKLLKNPIKQNNKQNKKNFKEKNLNPHFWNKSAHALEARPSLIYINTSIVGGSHFLTRFLCSRI